jgi:hypothetical protein
VRILWGSLVDEEWDEETLMSGVWPAVLVLLPTAAKKEFVTPLVKLLLTSR